MNRAERRRQQKLAKKAGNGVRNVPAPAVQQAIDLAVQHHSAGQLSEAEAIYQQILIVAPEHPVALRLLGTVAHQMGKNDIAVDLMMKAIAINPGDVDAHCNLGVILHELGKFDEAVARYHKALAIQSNFAVAHYNLGNAFKELGRLDEAAASYQKALAIKPDYAEAHCNLGIVLNKRGRLEEAVASYRNAVAVKPDYVDAHNCLGVALQALGNMHGAIASFREALTIKPDFAEAHYNLGLAYMEMERLDEAVASYQKAIAAKSDYSEAHNNLGHVLNELGKPEEAVISYHAALAITPNSAEAHNNLGVALMELGRLDEAVASYHKAKAITPDSAEASYNLGTAFRYWGKLGEAVTSYCQAIAIEPDFADAHNNLGSTLLGLGREKEGLDEFEWRWKIPANQASQRDFNQPKWNGAADLNSRTILLWSEQGVGDTLNWASCLSQVVSQAGLCVVEVQPKLVSLLARSFPKAAVRAEDRNSQPTDIDFHLPLGSLYHRLYPNIEYPTEAYLIPDPRRVAFWNERLAELGPGPYIGISWKSSLITPKRAPNYTRLAEWPPIFESRDAVFVNLQYGDDEDDLAAANRDFGARVHTFEGLDLYDDLDNVAALSKALDLIITVDNINAVISAGVGTPTWVLTWRQSNYNNFFCGPRVLSVTRFERNTCEPWDVAFEKIAECLKLRVLA